MGKSSNFIDLTGQRFGRLVVIKESGRKKDRSIKWLCKCDCGKETVTAGYELRSGRVTSCGCIKYDKFDLSGQRIGRLTVLEKVGTNKNQKAIYNCVCDCGTEKIITAGDLKSGRVISCGCVAKSNLFELHENNKTHGFSNSRIYHVWNGMLQRCENPNSTAYKDYGGRGIKVCKEWHDIKVFVKWAYENGYDENAERGDCTIDRIDVNGNYEPSNCRWVDMKVQANNKRNTKNPV